MKTAVVKTLLMAGVVVLVILGFLSLGNSIKDNQSHISGLRERDFANEQVISELLWDVSSLQFQASRETEYFTITDLCCYSERQRQAIMDAALNLDTLTFTVWSCDVVVDLAGNGEPWSPEFQFKLPCTGFTNTR